MTTIHHTILVLWGQGFDEIAAAIFVVELRRSGRRVKLVGLNNHRILGQHGLALVPDVTLDEALRHAPQACCLIIPAPLAALQQFSYDPRLAELLACAVRNHSLLVSNDSAGDGVNEGANGVANSPAHQPARNDEKTAFAKVVAPLPRLSYPAHAALIPFIHEVLSPQIE